MKRVLTILLAILMTLSLFACGQTKTPTPSESAPPSAPASEEPAGTVEDISENENSIGFFSTGIDPFSRDKYKIVFIYPRTMQLMQNLTDVFTQWGEKLNYDLIAATGDGDIDAYIQQIELYANQGVDGFVLNFDVNSRFRIKEVLDEIGIPYMAMLNSVRDEEGHSILPCVTMDGYALGQEMMQWLYDNQETYWGVKPDPSEVGYIGLTWSQNIDLHERYTGSSAKFEELYPGNKNIFSSDGVVGSMDADTGYNMSAPIFSGNPQIKYWYVVGSLEMYAQGAARAAEDLKIDDKVMVTTVGSDILSAEWDSGYEGCFVSCVAVSNYLYCTPTISALIAIIEGKATHDSLWRSKRAEGDLGTIYFMPTKIVTKDTYKSYFAEIQEAFENSGK